MNYFEWESKVAMEIVVLTSGKFVLEDMVPEDVSNAYYEGLTPTESAFRLVENDAAAKASIGDLFGAKP